jgi:hypothetical protein
MIFFRNINILLPTFSFVKVVFMLCLANLYAAVKMKLSLGLVKQGSHYYLLMSDTRIIRIFSASKPL